MRDCNRYIELIAARLDGSISDNENLELDKHLAGCYRCQQELLLQIRINESLKQPLPKQLPSEFVTRVEESIRRIERRRRIERSGVPLTVGVAVIAVWLMVAMRSLIVGALMAFLKSAGLLFEKWSNAVTDAMQSSMAALIEVIQSEEYVRDLQPLTMLFIVSSVIAIVIVVWASQRAHAFLRD